MASTARACPKCASPSGRSAVVSNPRVSGSQRVTSCAAGRAQPPLWAVPGPGASGGAKSRHDSQGSGDDAHWMDSRLVAVADFFGKVSSSTPFSYLAPALLSSTGLAKVKLRVA